MTIGIKPLFLVLLLSSLGIPSQVYAVAIEEIQIRSAEVKYVCQSIEGRYSVSMQAATQFEMAGEVPSASILFGEPKSKSYQSFECGGIKSTIYYYQYGNSKEVQEHLGAIKGILWGEGGPTKMHPELVLSIENVVIVVSSLEPWFFHRLLTHRIEFPSLDDKVVDHRLKSLGCVKDKLVNSQACLTLTKFLHGKTPTSLLVGENILIGRSWDVSDNAIVGDSNFESLYVSALENKTNVAAFGVINPENDDEYKQITDQMSAQSSNGEKSSSTGLNSFIRQVYGNENSASQITENGSLAFIGAGTRVYVRQDGNDIIMLTQLLNDSPAQPYVIATFPVGSNFN